MNNILKIEKCEIPDLLIFHLEVNEDERGYFTEKFQKEKMMGLGLPDFSPVQHNVSFNKNEGVTRGFHAEPWNKYASVISGEVFSAFIDLRKENFGRIFTLKINPDIAVYIPKGVANSFQTTKQNTYYSYLVDAHWSPEKISEYKYVNLADTRLGVDWPISIDRAIVSDKDKNHPMLDKVIPF